MQRERIITNKSKTSSRPMFLNFMRKVREGRDQNGEKLGGGKNTIIKSTYGDNGGIPLMDSLK